MLKNIEETNQPIYSPNNISLSVMKIIYAEIIFSNEELSEKKLIEILNEEIIKILLKKLIENSLIENYGNSNEITDKLMIAKNDDQSFYKNTKKILNMVVEKIGFISLDKLLKEIQKYERLRKFENEFEDLVIRFSRIRKTKEEKVKYLVRKSLKYLKNKFVFKGSSKDKFQNFVNHYFGKENSNMILKNENFKLINNEFLRKIFSSELFKKEFKEFLENDNFEKIVKLDNKSKINLLSAKILSFLKKSENEKIKKLKNLPWLKIWQIETKKLGFELFEIRNSKCNFLVNESIQFEEKLSSFKSESFKFQPQKKIKRKNSI